MHAVLYRTANTALVKDATHEKSESATGLKVWSNKEFEVEKKFVYKRFTFSNVVADFLDSLMLNKGILFTFKELLIRPGRVVRGFLDTERERYTHPIRMFILLAGVYVILILTFGLYQEEMAAGIPQDDELSKTIALILQNYVLRYLNIWLGLGTFAFALFSYLLWRKCGYNYVEHLIANIFLNAAVIGISIPLELVHVHADKVVFYSLYIVIFFAYSLWFLRDTFKKSWLATFWRSLIYFVCGTVLFNVLLMFVLGLLTAFYLT